MPDPNPPTPTPTMPDVQYAVSEAADHPANLVAGAAPPSDAMFEVTRTLVYRGTIEWLDKTRMRSSVPWTGVRMAGGRNTITATATEPVLVTDRALAIEKLREHALALGFDLTKREFR